MPFNKAFVRKISALIGLLLPLAWAFQSCQKADTEEVFSLSTGLADSLRSYDSVRVVLKDESGNILDILYHGPVLQASDLKNLPAPHFTGEKVVITVIGYDSNTVVFEVRKSYNPATGRTDSTTPILLSNSSVSISVDSLVLTEGDSADLPTASVSPGNLADKTLAWTTSDSRALIISSNRLRALQPGSVYLTATLASDTSKHRSILVRIRSLTPPNVVIVYPHDSLYTNQRTITVSWTVDGNDQSAYTQETLQRSGANWVIRSAQDALGRTYSDSITVFLDTVLPAGPSVHGPALTNSTTPTWTWSTGGNGTGTYRYRLDNPDLTIGATTITDTAYTPASDLSEAAHTLYVQEKDVAGNWSLNGSLRIRVDLTAPGMPSVFSPAAPFTNNRRPAWIWRSGGNGGSGSYRVRMDNPDLTTGTTAVTDTLFSPTTDLSETNHVLYVQERDSAGNWSQAGNAAVTVDVTQPLAPAVSVAASPTNDATPTWSWIPGGGGMGTYRYRLDSSDMSNGTTVISGRPQKIKA